MNPRSDSDNGIDEPLHLEDTFSGKLYWLNPPSGQTLDLERLKEEFQDRAFQEDISDEYDFDDVIVPDIFKQDGQMVRTTTAVNVSLVRYDGSNVIVGDLILDDVDRIEYRSDSILILDTTKAKFLIFQEGGFNYLAVLANRELAQTVVSILRDEFSEFGSIINATRLGADAISNIRSNLDATLMDTIITDYDQSEITQTRIQGESYEDTEVYEQLGSEGKVKSHLFQSDVLVPDDTKTILIGRDGLVRIYSNATIQTYLKLLKFYVIPEVHRDVGSSPSVGSWETISHDAAGSIFTEE